MIILHLVLRIIFICGATAYKWSSSLLNFDEAILYCKAQLNSSLATISNTQQDLIVSKLCSSHGITNCWIGSHQDIHEPNQDKCFETKRHAYKLNGHSIYTSDMNNIPCKQLRHPICNDPPTSAMIPDSVAFTSLKPPHQIYESNHNRKLLQTQRRHISCNDTHRENGTCVIFGRGDIEHTTIECNPNYPRCEVYFYRFNSEWLDRSRNDSLLHCPRNHCISCDIIINNTYASQLEIHGYECRLVSIRIVTPAGSSISVHGPYGLIHSVVYAPAAGGTLRIDGGVLYNNEILSTLGTA
eukprot:714197_1